MYRDITHLVNKRQNERVNLTSYIVGVAELLVWLMIGVGVIVIAWSL